MSLYKVHYEIFALLLLSFMVSAIIACEEPQHSVDEQKYTVQEIKERTLNIMKNLNIPGDIDSITIYGRADSNDIFFDQDASGICFESEIKSWDVWQLGKKVSYPVKQEEYGMSYDTYSDRNDDTIIVVYPSRNSE